MGFGKQDSENEIRENGIQKTRFGKQDSEKRDLEKWDSEKRDSENGIIFVCALQLQLQSFKPINTKS
jgi:hypothetical protein